MDRSFDFAVRGCAARFTLEIRRAAQLGHIAIFILHHLFAFNDVGVLEPHFAPGLQPKIFWRRHFREIRAVDEEFAAERNFARAGTRIFRVVDGLQFFHLVFRIICNDYLDRSQHRKPAGGVAIEFLADGVLEQGHVRHARIFCDPDVVGEIAQGARGHAAPPKAGNSRHSRIVPAVDEPVVHQLDQFPLAHDGVGKVEPREFVLMRERSGEIERGQDPVVKRPMHLELERADASA